MIKEGEAFWEPGGDLIHYQAASPTGRPASWS